MHFEGICGLKTDSLHCMFTRLRVIEIDQCYKIDEYSACSFKKSLPAYLLTISGVMSKNVWGGGGADKKKKSESPHSNMQAPLNYVSQSGV